MCWHFLLENSFRSLLEVVDALAQLKLVPLTEEQRNLAIKLHNSKMVVCLKFRHQ